MKISRERLLAEAEGTGFRTEILEKALQLFALLEGFRAHPFLKGRLALKGGTALNLFEFNVPRLSVDVDLNYVGAADRETMTEERPRVEEAVRAVCAREGMAITRVPSDHAGGKWRLQYGSALGGNGNLEVDLNFMFRVPLWDVEIRDSRRIGSHGVAGIPVMNVHELAAGKLAALLSRHASRDLFDAHMVLTEGKLDSHRLRLAFVVYGAGSRKDWRTVSANDVAVEPKELRDELFPVMPGAVLEAIRKDDTWAATLVEECRAGLKAVLPFTDRELAFLDGILDGGAVDAALLTDDKALIRRIQSHPLLLWKALNVREHKGG